MSNYLKQLVRVWNAPGNRNRRCSALMRALTWMVRTRFSRKAVERRVFSNSKIWCHPDGFASRSIMLYGEWGEYDSLKFLHHFLRPSDNFLDVGANIGLFTFLAAETLRPEAIVSVEPGTIQRSRLMENLSLNNLSDIRVFPFAAGEQEDTLRLTKDDAVAHLRLGRPGSQDGTTEDVCVRRLDDFLPNETFELTKIDVEGFELYALRGAQRLISEGRMPVILFEINGGSERYGIKAADTCDYLKSLGYQLGVYRHDEAAILTRGPLWDDVLAFNEEGLTMITSRLPEITLR